MKAEQCTPYWGFNKRTLVIETEDGEEIDRYYVDWLGVDVKKVNVINVEEEHARIDNTTIETERQSRTDIQHSTVGLWVDFSLHDIGNNLPDSNNGSSLRSSKAPIKT